MNLIRLIDLSMRSLASLVSPFGTFLRRYAPQSMSRLIVPFILGAGMCGSFFIARSFLEVNDRFLKTMNEGILRKDTSLKFEEFFLNEKRLASRAAEHNRRQIEFLNDKDSRAKEARL